MTPARSVLACGLLTALLGSAAPEPLRVQWGGNSLRVMGIDEVGRLRLIPDGPEAGEALLPLADAVGLHFELPADYRRARQLAWDGRGGEALLLLRSIVPALVPYVAAPESNAGPAVRLYLRLLVEHQAWAEALAVLLAMNPEAAGRWFASESAALVRGLQHEQRPDELKLLLERWWVSPPDDQETENRHATALIADGLRRDGCWSEAAILYRKLRVGTAGEIRRRHDLLLAYLDWHQGGASGAQAVLSELPEPAATEETGALYRLLLGRVALQEGRTREALDALAEALVGAGGAGEWRLELTAVLVQAYQQNGDSGTAARIARDLRTRHPDSRWVAGLEEKVL